MATALSSPRLAFLFLGETLLIPHLWPIAEAVAQAAPAARIDLWVSTSVHQALLGRWAQPYGTRMRVRRAPGFRRVAHGEDGHNPQLPPKLPMLARLLPWLLRADAIVCAEQTSLWLPTALPFLRRRFVKTAHGAGSMSARDDRRRRMAALTLVPSLAERARLVERGLPPARVVATGYVKSGFRQRTPPTDLFSTDRPILLYAPHWQRHRSSWWDWGEAIVGALAEQRDWNVILAPHQRLAEKVPGLGDILAAAARHPHVHADLDGFAMVDGSYTAAADIYLGDTSSQVVEFLAQPRPCVFLNSQRAVWADDPSYAFWRCGDVVDTLAALPAALAAAPARHHRYKAAQARFATQALGDTADRAGAERAAGAILDWLRLRG